MENLEVICRVCLKISPITAISPITEKNSGLDLIEKIFLISGVLIYVDEQWNSEYLLPSKVCQECKDAINAAYNIREMCIKSDKFLQDINSVKFHDDDSSKKDDKSMKEDENEIQISDEQAEEFYLEEFLSDAPQKSVESLNLFEIEERNAEDANPLNISISSVFEEPSKRKNLRMPCYICAQLISKRNMYLHLKTHDTTFQKFICDLCKKEFKIKSYLSSHIKNIHLTNKKFKCNMCDKSYSKKSTYVQHLKIHTKIDLNNFSCHVCLKTFALKNRLKVHMRTHFFTRPFECNFENCTRSFKHQTDLKRHKMSQHTLERPYKCIRCEKGFVKNSQLTSHSKRCK